MARWREYNFYYVLPDGKVQYGGAWKRDRSEWVSDEEIAQSIPKEALAVIYTEDVESFGGYDSHKNAWVHWIDDDIETKLPGGRAIVDSFIQQFK
ncbi:MAG: hypothetical protein ACRAVC_18630 [Trichormus sp.]